MRFLLITQSERGASSRYRVHQFVPALERAGIDAHVAPMPKGWFERRRLLRTAADYDLVLVQKRTVDRFLLATLRRRARRLVFDLDDAIMIGAGRAKPSQRRQSRFRRMVQACDLVMAGNAYLAEQAQRWGARTAVMPTVVDLERYPTGLPGPDPGHFTLGWIGSRSTLPYLEAIAPAIDDLALELPQLRLQVVCDAFPHLDRTPVIETPWAEETEARELARFDVGLMPLPDSAWTRGKCGLKILQYFAAGRPALCSPVGVNAEIVTDGETGRFASSPQEWQAAIRELALDHSLCEAMGIKARARVAEAYSLRAWGERWVQTLVDAARA